MKTEREKRGLRGPVKAVHTQTARFKEKDGQWQETSWHEHTTAFDARGNVTEEVYRSPDGSAFRSVYTYDAAGRPAGVAHYDRGGSLTGKLTYAYDDRGRLIEETYQDAGGTRSHRKSFAYDADGRKTAEEVFDDGYFEARADAADDASGGGAADGAICAAPGADIMIGVEGTDVSVSASGARALRTFYDPRGNPTEVRVLGARGRLIQKILLTYDPEGRLVGEAHYGVGELFPCGEQTRWSRLLAPAAVRLVRAYVLLRSLYAARGDLKKVARSLACGPLMSETTYAYDAQGRQTERVVNFWGVTFSRTKFVYDEHGDKAEEIYEHGRGDASQTSKAVFTREYDGHGNWTRELVSSASSWDVEFGTSVPSHVTRRAITYY